MEGPDAVDGGVDGELEVEDRHRTSQEQSAAGRQVETAGRGDGIV